MTQQSRSKQRNGSTSTDSSSAMTLFKQTTQSDPFAQWCEEQLKKLPAAKNLDGKLLWLDWSVLRFAASLDEYISATSRAVATFVAFLRDIESPYEVKDYVTSYLGEGRQPREFAEGFIQQRNNFLKQQKQRSKRGEPEAKKQVGPCHVLARSAAHAPTFCCRHQSQSAGDTRLRKHLKEK